MKAGRSEAWWWAAAWLVAAAAGCGEDGATAEEPAAPPRSSPVTLIDQNLWRLAEASEDPLPAHRPEEVRCVMGGGVTFEQGALEINTDLCNYATLVQPAQTHIQRGEVIRVVGWNQGLFADPPAEAHLALLADGVVLWEATLPVPGPAEVYTPEVVAPQDFPAGVPLVLHVHNHGANSYYFVTVTVGGEPEAAE